jgi:hypothetical protein
MSDTSKKEEIGRKTRGIGNVEDLITSRQALQTQASQRKGELELGRTDKNNLFMLGKIFCKSFQRPEKLVRGESEETFGWISDGTLG